MIGVGGVMARAAMAVMFSLSLNRGRMKRADRHHEHQKQRKSEQIAHILHPEVHTGASQLSVSLRDFMAMFH